jgi:hypothetical protein
VLRSAGVANTEDETRSPIFGKGMMPEDGIVSKLRGLSVLERWVGGSLPEWNGTTDAKGEYGRASSTVSGLGFESLVLCFK